MPKMARWPRLSGVVGEQVIQPRSCLPGRVNTGLGITVPLRSGPRSVRCAGFLALLPGAN
jgi:hypothetical protein